MRRIASSLTVAAMAAGVSLSSVAPAYAAGPFCFGLPDEPLAYVCVTVNVPAIPDPTVTWEPWDVAYVPVVCYGVGCTSAGPVSVPIPSVSGIGVPTLVEIYWAGLPREVRSLVSQVEAVLANPGAETCYTLQQYVQQYLTCNEG